jgi:hypothetical protein
MFYAGGRHGCWCYCSCGWYSGSYPNPTTPQLLFGSHFLRATAPAVANAAGAAKTPEGG